MPLHSQQFSCDVSAPRLARAWIKGVVRGVRSPDGFWRDGIVHDLELCASELVNLSLIANSTAITVRLLIEPGVFRLSLVDDCPILTDSADPAFHAQNVCLLMIEACCESFGIADAELARELWVQFRASSPDLPQKRIRRSEQIVNGKSDEVTAVSAPATVAIPGLLRRDEQTGDRPAMQRFDRERGVRRDLRSEQRVKLCEAERPGDSSGRADHDQ